MKWNIVNFSATVIFGVVSVVGLIYTLWPGTDPNISSAYVNVSADMIALGLLLLGAVALSIPLILGSRLLWPVVRQRLKTRRQRFSELAPELHTLPSIYSSSPAREMRFRVMLDKLRNLGINLPGPEHSNSLSHSIRLWILLDRCFQDLAILADEGRLDQAREVSKRYAKRMIP